MTKRLAGRKNKFKGPHFGHVWWTLFYPRKKVPKIDNFWFIFTISIHLRLNILIANFFMTAPGPEENKFWSFTKPLDRPLDR